MIVISHPWEFVPKGSTHLNSLGGGQGSTITSTTSSSTSSTSQQATSSTKSANDVGGQTRSTDLLATGSLPASSQQLQQQPYFYLQKSHVNRILQSQNINVKGRPPQFQLSNSQGQVSGGDDSSLSDISFAYLHNKSPLINRINFETSTEKWHLKQVNEYCDNEIYIRDNKVILSYGVDNDSKVISRTFTFDSPISDCNWFNFKTDSNISGVIRDCLCMFELNKIHVYFPNGSDFHIQLPFKLKNCWKLRNGLLIEKQVEYSSIQPLGYLRSNQPSQVFFTISNPLDEIKPILCRNNSSESKTLYLRENSKQVIVDVIESLNLVLVFSVLNNVHSLYRITDYLSEDSQLVNNLLNGTITQLDQLGDATTTTTTAVPPATINTPLSRTMSKKLTVNQTPRLSVSPIISTHSFYNKLALNSPLAYQQQQQGQQSSASNQSSSKTLMPPHLMMSQQRSFSPLATLSRSPSCSSSPALMANLLNSAAAARRAHINSNYSALANSSRSFPIQPNPSTNSGSNQYLTPLIEVDQYRTPQTGLLTTSRYQTAAATTAMINNMTSNNTPINRRNLNFTPSCQTMLSTTLAGIPNATALQMSNEPLYEQMQPEYAFELVWSESASAAESSLLPTTTSASYCERATKFFHQVDFYAQRYVCYLLSQRAQLRCVKVEYTPETDELLIQSPVHVISARDAVYVEQRQLMVVLDAQGALFVYSGLNKLCKLHLSNIVWSSLSPTNLATAAAAAAREQPSPVATPVKSNKLLFSGDLSAVEMRPSITSSTSKAPPRPQQQQEKSALPPLQPQQQSLPNVFLQPQTEFKSLTDSTGSHFSVKLKDNRLVRVNLGEQSTCKLVQLCLDALKYTLGQDIYVELVQQWYIHRYSVSTSAEQSIKDELSLFLYLIANLCGSFDLSRLERDLPVLGTLNLAATSSSTSQGDADEESKRAKCAGLSTSLDAAPSSTEAVVDDWSYLCQDELIVHLSEAEKNLKEFDYASLANAAVNKPEPQQTREKTPSELNTGLEPTKILLNASLRQKRSISSTLNTSSTGYSSGASTLQGSTSTASSSASGGGILYPHMKQLLYTLHLVYEEAKLYRSLYQQLSSLVQILYLLANELGLTAYMSYYESEMPILIKLKAQKVFSPPSQPPSAASTSSNTFTNKGFTLNQLINLDPPVLSRFLFDLMSLNRDSSINPFPTIPGVCKRTQRAIKIYAVCALCTNPQLSAYSYEDFTNQLFFRVNLTNNNMDQSINGERFLFKPGVENLHENIFSLCLDMGLCTLNEIYDYPFHVLFPVLESINWSRDNPCFSWPSFAFELIGRNDLAILKAQSDMISASSMGQAWYGNNEEQQDPSSQAASNDQANGFSSMNRIYQNSANYNYFQNQLQSMLTFGGKKKSSNRRGAASSTATESSGSGSSGNGESGDDGLTLNTIHSLRKEDEDGMQHVSDLETLKCRFGDDLRVKEIRTCLQTTRPIQIKLQQGPDVSDHDFLEEEEKFLSLVCLRTMALPVGRGIFTLHTVDPIPTEPVVIPDLNLKGKSLTKKTTIDLTRIEVPANMTYWPSFHNGVAAGLTISAQARDLSNAWIKSHLAKNFELTNEQAGFLYGLGLSGHLANFSMLNIHDALARRHDLTNIAILLGLAASKIGSMDLSLTRLISMHIKSLMPPVEIELETPYNIQIAALLSLGLVYVRTANKHLSYVLLKEIGRLPGNEVGDKDLHSFDREAYSLTAGLSLGLILLEQGKHSLTIMDPTFTDELYHYMVGGHKEHWRGDDAQSSNAAASSSAAANETGGGSSNFRHTSSAAGGGSSSNTASASAAAGTNNTNSSYIREGESINTNVTCPGATLALGLIYFNTCDRLIGEWFAPPDSAFLLDSLRPDFLLLRTVARNLIAWRYVLPTQAWLIGQLSPLLKSVVRGEKLLAEKFANLLAESTVPPPQAQTQISKQPSQKMPPTQLATQKKPKEKLEVVSLSEDSDDDEDHVHVPEHAAATDRRPQDEPDDDVDDDDDTELAESDLSDDTDAENNIIVSKRGRVKKKPILTSKHPLGDLIRFDSMSSDSSSDHDFEHLMSACLKQPTSQTSNIKPSTSRQAAGLVADIESISSESNSSSSGSGSGSSNGENMVDSETKTEAFRHIIAGACMSIGLKFAGTCNAQAFETLLFWSQYFTDLADAKLSTESCLCVCVVSLALVMAGSGDLDVLRLCRYLRSRVGGAYGGYVTYGSQMAVSMALGLLFMGGGKYSFKTDALSVALMLAAFYPQFPVESNDNRFHLQAFRHLYVLAAEPRLLLPRDVDTNEFCYVPIEIKLKATEHYQTFEYKQMAPCILPELNKIQELKILGPRYYPITFKDSLHFTDLRNILLSELLVKQKNGYYSYSDDPKDEKAFNIRNFLNKMIIPHKITPNLLEQITNEEHINAFAQMLNKSNENKLSGKTNRLLKIIYESVIQETFDFVGVMLLLDKEANSDPNAHFIQQMKLVDVFYKSLNQTSHTKSKYIVNMEFLHATMSHLEETLREKIKNKRELISIYLSGSQYDIDIENLINYCVLTDISRNELEKYSRSINLAELISDKSLNANSIAKLLKLYQLYRTYN